LIPLSWNGFEQSHLKTDETESSVVNEFLNTMAFERTLIKFVVPNKGSRCCWRATELHDVMFDLNATTATPTGKDNR